MLGELPADKKRSSKIISTKFFCHVEGGFLWCNFGSVHSFNQQGELIPVDVDTTRTQVAVGAFFVFVSNNRPQRRPHRQRDLSSGALAEIKMFGCCTSLFITPSVQLKPRVDEGDSRMEYRWLEKYHVHTPAAKQPCVALC